MTTATLARLLPRSRRLRLTLPSRKPRRFDDVLAELEGYDQRIAHDVLYLARRRGVA